MAQKETDNAPVELLQPWEHKPAVGKEDAFAEVASDLENDLFGGEPKPKAKKEAAVEAEEEAEETDDAGEAEEEPEVEEEVEEAEEGEGQEWDFTDEQWDEIVRSRPHRIKVDGEFVEVTYDEAQAGYSRTEDYTRKSQQRETEHAAAVAETQAVRGKLIEQLKAVEATLAAADGEHNAAYWDNLRGTDPAKFAVEWADSERRRMTREGIAVKRQEQEEVQAKDLSAARRAHDVKEFTTLKTKMGWADDAAAAKTLQELAVFAAKEYGFTNEQLSNVTDHRLWVMLHQAKEYQALQNEGSEKIREKLKKPKVLKPGGQRVVRPTGKPGARKVNQKAINAAQKRLRESGSVSAAAALFEGLLSDED
jgi:hypothetical protein